LYPVFAQFIMPQQKLGKSKRTSGQKEHLSAVNALHSGHTSVADSGQTPPAKNSKPHSGSNDVQIALEVANVELYKTVCVET
jgi:hypothetical protein